METLIGIAVWAMIFLVWYFKNYPEKLRDIVPVHRFKIKWPRIRRTVPSARRPVSARQSDFKALVETVESVCARDRFGSSEAAAMVHAVKKIMEIEPSSGQIWEAYALDSLESAEIVCDDCGITVDKTIKKTGIKIRCKKCEKWLALKNSKVMIIDPSRRDLEDWEK
jgi:hypothetical protein